MKRPLALSVAALMFAGLPVTSTQAQNSKFNTFYSDIGGGTLNAIGTGAYTWIGGGLYNQIYSNNSGTISGGFSNVIFVGNWATIGGGAQNFASGSFATVGGGQANQATNTYATVGGGLSNAATAPRAAIGGGERNVASGFHAAIAGGDLNVASGNNAAVGGGVQNTASGATGTIGGGFGNVASASHATVGGGYGNQATGAYATVPGGFDNDATASDSFAAGSGARATNDASFVWGGVFNVETTSTNAQSFTARAPGGVRFITSTNLVGAILASEATAWAALSDSNAKTDIEPVNAREVLKKVAALPVTSWHYKHDLNRRYIGPMAQDFHAAFGLGADDKTITTLDTDGVTLAAIKGLVEELEARDVEIGELKARLAERDRLLEQRLQAIDERLGKLPPSP